MKKIIVITILASVTFLATLLANVKPNHKPRVIAMTDGEVDDRCSMIRFLLYTNEMDVVAIIQTNSVFQPKGWSKEHWLEAEIDAYGQVYPNLIIHDPFYPTPEFLRSRVLLGDEDSSHLKVDGSANLRIPGMKPMIDPSNWADTPGSEKILETLLDKDPSPVFIQAWGGGNTAVRAFYKLKMKYPEQYKKAISKVVMYNIWYQDGAGSYIEQHFPEVTMLLSHHFSGTWDYGSQSYTQQFVKESLQNGHGALGKMYFQNYISEGDSPAFLYLLSDGLRGYENPTFGGWGGQFYKVNGFKNVYRDVDGGSYLRWVEYANRDFQSKLNWCVSDTYEKANHKPIIKIKGGLDRTVKAGQKIVLEAEISDNDPVDLEALWEKWGPALIQQGRDKSVLPQFAKMQPKFTQSWWQYKEAGTYNGNITLSGESSTKIEFTAPQVTKPQTIHIVLEAKDHGGPALTTFARVIITVVPAK